MDNVIEQRTLFHRPPAALVGYVAFSTVFELAVIAASAARSDESAGAVGFFVALVLAQSAALLFGVRFAYQAALAWSVLRCLGALSPSAGLAILVPLVVGAVRVVLLRRSSVREFFGLRCPRCRELSGRYTNLRCTRASCRCGTTWEG